MASTTSSTSPAAACRVIGKLTFQGNEAFFRVHVPAPVCAGLHQHAMERGPADLPGPAAAHQ